MKRRPGNDPKRGSELHFGNSVHHGDKRGILSLEPQMNARDLVRLLLVVLLPSMVLSSSSTRASDSSDYLNNTYFQPNNVTKLEGNLLQFNLAWHDSYDPSRSYLGSHATFFNYKNRRFHCVMRVQDTRCCRDFEPFCKLPKWKQHAILQESVNHFFSLFLHYFPEMKKHKEGVFIEFIFWPTGTAIANYENEKLTFLE